MRIAVLNIAVTNRGDNSNGIPRQNGLKTIQMSASFWIALVVCGASFLLAWIDYGETFDAFKRSHGKERRQKLCKLILIWGVPAISLAGTLVSAWESGSSESQLQQMRISASNALSRAVAVEERQKPRHLTQEVNDRLITDLGTLKKFGVSLNCPIGDAEASDFMTELSSAFTKAGFAGVNMALLPGTFKPGVVMETPSSVVPEQIGRVAKALETAGIGGTLALVTNASQSNVTIYIGSKY